MKAEYIQHMGSDLTVVNAARVSFDKESEWGTIVIDMEVRGQLNERDSKLINYLSRNGHFTPFTHCTITLRESVPIFVARQRFKHTVGFSYNETSRRYVDSDPEFYTPDKWRKRAENVKQGSSDEEVTSLDWWFDMSQKPSWYGPTLKQAYKDHIESTERLYKVMIASGVAPEQARMVLPQSMYTSYYVTGSLMAFARAYKLRTDPHAQLEIQTLAKQWGELLEPLYPVSWRALTDV